MAKVATPRREEVSAESQTLHTWGFLAARRGVGEVLGPMCRISPIFLPRKAPENQEEEEEERAELNQSEEPEAAESNAGGP